MDEEVIDDDCELILEKVEEEMLADYMSDDDNDDVLIKVDDLKREFKVKLYFFLIDKLFYFLMHKNFRLKAANL